MALIDALRDRWGVEPICQALEVAPSTYYAATSRPASPRRLRDEELKVEIARVHKENLGVYGGCPGSPPSWGGRTARCGTGGDGIVSGRRSS